MATFHVETTGNDQTGDGSTANPWLTVSHAFAQAAPGSTVEIGLGNFTEALVIDKNLTVRGAGSYQTVLWCPQNLPETLGAVQFESPVPSGREFLTILPMVHISGKVKVRFENLQFNGSAYAIGLSVSAKDAELEFESCRVIHFRNCFIVVMDGKLVVSNSEVGNGGYLLHSDLGIMIGNNSRAVITNTEVGSLTDHCLDFYQDSVSEVTHCTLLGSDTTNTNGIRLSGNAWADISHNTIQGQTTTTIPSNTSQAGIQIGIQTYDTAGADIHHNVITGFSRGITSNCSTATRVWGNTITDNFNGAFRFFSLTGAVPDLGGGPQGSPGENIIHDNGSLSGFDIELMGDVFTCFARFNDWGTTDPAAVTARVGVETVAPSTLDFLPFKQVPEPTPLDSILLLDQSGSMLDEGKWQSALAAADVFAFGSSFINFDLAQLRLALITFAGTSQGDTNVWQNLAPLPSVASPISSLITNTPDPSWSTPMGSGLQWAELVLNAASSTAQRRYVFLLSDGMANTGPPPESVYPGFQQRINVYSIGFGDDSIDPETLSNISNATLGDYALTKTTDNLDLKRFFLNSLANPLNFQIIVNTREPGVTTFPVNFGEPKMLVLIGWQDTSLQIDFDLEMPNGTLITPSSPAGAAYRADTGASFASYTIQNPMAGEWQFANIRQQSGGAAPEVCKFVAVDPALVAQFWLDRGVVAMGQSLRLNTRLLENNEPLDNATITVEVSGPQFSLGTLVLDHLAAQPKLVDQISRRLPTGRALQRSDILHDYRRRQPNRLLPIVSEGMGLARIQHPAGASVASGIFQTQFTPAKEGTYTFEFVAEGVTRSGAAFRRSYTVSKYVSFAADPTQTKVAITAVRANDLRRQDLTLYAITVIPIAANGDRMGPFASVRIKVHSDGRDIASDIQDNLDGSYSAQFSLEPSATLSTVRVFVDRVEIPVAQKQPKPRGCLFFWRRWLHSD